MGRVKTTCTGPHGSFVFLRGMAQLARLLGFLGTTVPDEAATVIIVEGPHGLLDRSVGQEDGCPLRPLLPPLPCEHPPRIIQASLACNVSTAAIPLHGLQIGAGRKACYPRAPHPPLWPRHNAITATLGRQWKQSPGKSPSSHRYTPSADC
jgi:hypothetical protein